MMTREEVIKRLKNIPCLWVGTTKEREDTEEAIRMAIEALQDDWIPCSERLPEKTDMYLVTYGNTHGGKVGQMVYPLHYWHKRWMSFDHSWESKTVTAWMPFPKPYKGGDE